MNGGENGQKTCFNVERGKEKHSENHEPTFARSSGDTPGTGYSEIRSSGLAERSDQNGRGLPNTSGASENIRRSLSSWQRREGAFPEIDASRHTNEWRPARCDAVRADQARQLIREMEQALEDRYPAEFALRANRYAQLLEDHIAKEDNILFPKAEDVLTNEDDEALLHRFDEIESEMSEATHERFHYMLDTLASHYQSKPLKAS
jgi:hypothetical protein